MRATVLFLLTVLFSPGAALGRQIIYPPDGSLVREGDLEVLGFRPAGEKSGSLTLSSGGKPQKKSVKPGQFSLSVTLSPGVNTVLLGEEMVRVFYAPEEVPGEASAYKAPDRHAVDNSCDDCHAFESDGAPLSEEGSALCYSCHDDFSEAEGVSLHPPVEDGECLECHVFHGSALTGLPAEDLTGMCFGCHDEFAGEEDLSLHPPVEEGECLECHDPHGTVHGALLTAAPEEICFNCHDNPGQDDSGGEWGTPHPALDDGCTACHTPHASRHGSLLTSGLPDLCSECHDDKNADDEGNEWGTPHPPVEEGACADCHLPHGSAESALLKVAVPGLCSECHDDKNADDEGNEWGTPHPPVEEGACVDCHQPHGSAEGALLKEAVPGLCSECHDDKRVNEEQVEWADPHPPAASGECAACHLPHGSDEGALLLRPPNALCAGCHEEVHDIHRTFDEEAAERAAQKGVVPPESFPVNKEGSFVCTGCHLPHGSDSKSLWPGEMADFCTICHPY